MKRRVKKGDFKSNGGDYMTGFVGLLRSLPNIPALTKRSDMEGIKLIVNPKATRDIATETEREDCEVEIIASFTIVAMLFILGRFLALSLWSIWQGISFGASFTVKLKFLD